MPSSTIRRLHRDQRGLSSVEYVVLAVLIVSVSASAWQVFGNDVRCKLGQASAGIFGALGTPTESKGLEQCGSAGDSAGGLARAPWQDPAAAGDPGGSTSRRAGEDSGDATDRAPKGKKPVSKKAQADAWTKGVLRVMCPGDKAFLQDLEKRGVSITLFQSITYNDPIYDGTRWTTKPFPAAGTQSAGQLEFIQNGAPEDDASVVIHEGTHAMQPATMSPRAKEYDAYFVEDQWRLARGLPPAQPGFRTKGPGGKETTNVAAIKAFVDSEYQGDVPSPTGGPPERIKSHDPKTGETIVRRANGTTYRRPPIKGDFYQSNTPVQKPPGGIPIDMAKLQCP